MAEYLRGQMMDHNYHNRRNCHGSCFVVKKQIVSGTWGWLNGGSEVVKDWYISSNEGYNEEVFDAECQSSGGRTPIYKIFKAICL